MEKLSDSLPSHPLVPTHLHVKCLHSGDVRDTNFCSRSVTSQFLCQKETTEHGKSIAATELDSFY